jgi:hypothetical protein
MDVDRVGTTKKLSVDEVTKSNVKNISEMLNGKVMDAPVTLTVRELIKLRPATLKPLVNYLYEGRKTDLAALVQEEHGMIPINLEAKTSRFCSVMVVYLDDLCVVSKTEEQHLEHLRKVFQFCLKWGVCSKFAKCQFGTKTFRFLGLICTLEGVLPDPGKAQALVDRQEPKNVKELRSYVYLGSYFQTLLKLRYV